MYLTVSIPIFFTGLHQLLCCIALLNQYNSPHIGVSIKDLNSQYNAISSHRRLKFDHERRESNGQSIGKNLHAKEKRYMLMQKFGLWKSCDRVSTPTLKFVLMGDGTWSHLLCLNIFLLPRALPKNSLAL